MNQQEKREFNSLNPGQQMAYNSYKRFNPNLTHERLMEIALGAKTSSDNTYTSSSQKSARQEQREFDNLTPSQQMAYNTYKRLNPNLTHERLMEIALEAKTSSSKPSKPRKKSSKPRTQNYSNPKSSKQGGCPRCGCHEYETYYEEISSLSKGIITAACFGVGVFFGDNGLKVARNVADGINALRQESVPRQKRCTKCGTIYDPSY